MKGRLYQNGHVCGHRRYDVAKLLGKAEKDGKTICYARVSTRPQLEDLQRQSLVLAGHCEKQGYSYEVIRDIGSGINYNSLVSGGFHWEYSVYE